MLVRNEPHSICHSDSLQSREEEEGGRGQDEEEKRNCSLLSMTPRESAVSRLF